MSCQRRASGTITGLARETMIVNRALAVECLLQMGQVEPIQLAQGPTIQNLVITFDVRLIGGTAWPNEAVLDP